MRQGGPVEPALGVFGARISAILPPTDNGSAPRATLGAPGLGRGIAISDGDRSLPGESRATRAGGDKPLPYATRKTGGGRLHTCPGVARFSSPVVPAIGHWQLQ